MDGRQIIEDALTTKRNVLIWYATQSLLIGADLAEDLFQTTAVHALENADKLQHDDHVSSWLIKMMHNLFVNAYRRESIRPGKESASSSRRLRHPGQVDVDMDYLDLERHLLRGVREERAEMIRMRARGYTQPEIAEALNVPLGTVSGGLYKVRVYVRKRDTAA